MIEHSGRITAAILLPCWAAVCVLLVLNGCGASEQTPEQQCTEESCLDASQDAGFLPIGWVDAAVSDPWAALAEAGNPSGGPLTVSLEVFGAQRSCDDCAVLSANVSGGQIPYSFAWDVPELSGPGPHQICDENQSRDYTLTVTDSTPASVEFGGNSQRSATATLACTPRQANASPGLSGCKLLLDASILSFLNPNGAYVERVYGCRGEQYVAPADLKTLDAGTQLTAQGFHLPEGMRTGQPYQFTLELLYPLTIGGNITFQLWGTRNGCTGAELLGDFKADGIARQSFCFTPQHDYEQLLFKPGANNEAPLLSIGFGVSMTLCKDCSQK